MKVTTDHTKAEITRAFTITENHPIVPFAYARPPKDIRVTHGSITYTWKDGEWVVLGETSITVSGVVLKKDGSDSKLTHHRWPTQVSYREPVFTERFAWLQPIVDLLRPRGDMSMMVLNEAEVGE